MSATEQDGCHKCHEPIGAISIEVNGKTLLCDSCVLAWASAQPIEMDIFEPPAPTTEGLADALDRHTAALPQRFVFRPLVMRLLAWPLRRSHDAAHALMQRAGFRYCPACKHLTGNRSRPYPFNRPAE